MFAHRHVRGSRRMRTSRSDQALVQTSSATWSVEGGSVDELLDVIVERPVLDQLQVEVGRTLEDWVQPGLTGDDGEERDLYVVDQAGGHQRPVQRQAAVR